MPLRQRDEDLIRRFEDFFSEKGFVLVGISDEILELATQIFADHRIKMADAIHTATAILGQCDVLVAKDDPWTNKSPVMGLTLKSLWD